jgi:cysteine desulfurase
MFMMNYFDYSATTPISDRVNEVMQRCERDFFANINAKHELAQQSRIFVSGYIHRMTQALNITESSLIFTSGATESNNMILFGLTKTYPNKRHILTTSLEHHSMISPLGVLQKQGYDIEFIPYINGELDLDFLKTSIRQDTLLVSIIAVESETGMIHPLKKIKAICDEHNVPLHSDMTQAIGKIEVDLHDVTYASFSSHKIYGPKGIGACIIHKQDIKPLIVGGRSLSKLRAGTPPNALIVGFAQALLDSLEHLKERQSIVNQRHQSLVEQLKHIDQIHFNQPKQAVNHICNLSIANSKRDQSVEKLSLYGCYASASSACSGQEDLSKAVFCITQNQDYASTSIRISLSHKTKQEEVDDLVNAIKKVINL